MADASVKIGDKVSDDEQKKLDMAKVGRTKNQPNKGASGQWLVPETVICPFCHALCNLVASTNVYNYYTCWNCGNVFRA